MATEKAKEILQDQQKWTEKRINEVLDGMVTILQSEGRRNTYTGIDWVRFLTKESGINYLQELAVKQAAIHEQLMLLAELEKQENH